MGTGLGDVDPKTKREWGELANKLNIKTIHIAERDTQVREKPKEVGEFVNTWSIDGFISEGCQPSEMGWGTHEKKLPHDGHHHTVGTKSAIWLNQPGVRTRVRTWTPMEKEFHGFCVTHNESISIADYFTLRGDDGEPIYRPTVHYAYHPCDDAVLSLHELAGKDYIEQTKKSLMLNDITSGVDELGVLLGGNAKGAYWYGSQLEVHHSRKLCELNQATSLQVTATAVAGAIWAIENPSMGVVEPDEIDHKRILDIITPYVAPVVQSSVAESKRNNNIGLVNAANSNVDQRQDECGQGESTQSQRSRVGELALSGWLVETGLELSTESWEARTLASVHVSEGVSSIIIATLGGVCSSIGGSIDWSMVESRGIPIPIVVLLVESWVCCCCGCHCEYRWSLLCYTILIVLL